MEDSNWRLGAMVMGAINFLLDSAILVFFVTFLVLGLLQPTLEIEKDKFSFIGIFVLVSLTQIYLMYYDGKLILATREGEDHYRTRGVTRNWLFYQICTIAGNLLGIAWCDNIVWLPTIIFIITPLVIRCLTVLGVFFFSRELAKSSLFYTNLQLSSPSIAETPEPEKHSSSVRTKVIIVIEKFAGVHSTKYKSLKEAVRL